MRSIFEKIHLRFYIFLSGILIGLSVLFAEVGFIAYFALIPLAYAIFKRIGDWEYKTKQAYIDGFVFFMSFDLMAFHWFVYFYPLDFAGLGKFESLIVIALAWVGLSMLQSVFSALTFIVISKLVKTSLYKKWPVLLVLVVASLFAVNEWTQTFTWAGVPWARMALSQTKMPILMQSASLFGPYFLTFIIVAFNFLLAYAIFVADKKRTVALAALAIMLIHTLLGTALYFIPRVDCEREIKVASVQGNRQSGTLEGAIPIYEAFAELTKNASADGAQLVVWPEGAFPLDIHSLIFMSGRGYFKISQVISELAQDLDVTIVLGSFVDGEGETRSAVSVFYPDGNQIINAYAKRKPVPFGEFLPMADVVYAVAPVLAHINIFSEVAAGEKSTVFDATLGENPIKVGTLICFDSIYEQLGIDTASVGAEMLIIPSNDSWFYDSRALYMHHAQNILRAVEQGKYTVNCGNTGITSIVSDKGEVINDMKIYTAGYVIDSVYASSGRTLYSYIGNLFVYICIAGVFAVFVIDLASKRR